MNFKNTIVWVLICVVFYLFWSFINLSIDFRDWGSLSRFIYGFGLIVSFFKTIE